VIALAQGQSTGRILRNIEAEGVTVSTTHYTGSASAQGLHYHQHPHLCLVLQGGDVEVRRSAPYRRHAGEIFFYHAGEQHGTCSRERSSLHAMLELSCSFLDRHGLSESQLANAVRENINAKFLMLKLQHELRTRDSHTPLGIHALVLELVNYSRTRYERTPPRWVPQVAELLSAHWNRPMTLGELSEATGTHPVTISKHFRKYFSCTLGEHRRRLMIERSMPLITESRMPLSEIAFHCGFADQSHFIRSFQQATGFRPGDYRRL